jgi:hypothetical protein
MSVGLSSVTESYDADILCFDSIEIRDHVLDKAYHELGL